MTLLADWIGMHRTRSELVAAIDRDGTAPQAGWTGRTLRRLALLAGVVVVIVASRRWRFERRIENHADELFEDTYSEPRDRARFTSADLDGLPAPVSRYFRTVLEDGQPYVRTVRLHQRGAFRLGDRDGTWRPLEAVQHVTTLPPGFVWSAEIDVTPLFPVRVVDLYRRGDGILRAKLLSVIPVASAGPSPEMNAGELVRYLAEAVWYPTALLPARGVEWEPIDERTARATLEHRGVTASLVFHFDDRDEVERVTAERYRQEAGADVPWTGHFRSYEVRNGRRIPVEAAVEWNLPDGDLPYWRARVDAIEHDGLTGGTR